MEDRRKTVGRRGEDLAAAFLRTKGFEIVEKNWSCRMGEIDLIARRGDEVRFIEVKLRLTTTYGYPEEAITKTKLQHLSRAIELWLRSHELPPRYQADAVSILVLAGKEPEIRWIEGVL